MPITKSAIKKMRQDKKRATQNRKIKEGVKSLIKKARLSPTLENIKNSISSLDKAGKKGIYHKNKVARIKSRLSKLSKEKQATKPQTPKKTKKRKVPKKA